MPREITKEAMEEREQAREAARARLASVLGKSMTKIPLAQQAFVRIWTELLGLALKVKKQWQSGAKVEGVGVYDAHRLEGLMWFLKNARRMGLPITAAELKKWDVAQDLIEQVKKDARDSLESSLMLTQGEARVLSILLVNALEKERLAEVARQMPPDEKMPPLIALQSLAVALNGQTWCGPESLSECVDREVYTDIDYHWMLKREFASEEAGSSETGPDECSDPEDPSEEALDSEEREEEQ